MVRRRVDMDGPLSNKAQEPIPVGSAPTGTRSHTRVAIAITTPPRVVSIAYFTNLETETRSLYSFN